MVKNIGFGDTVYIRYLCLKRPVGEPFYVNGVKHTDYTIKSDIDAIYHKKVVVCVAADGTLLLENGQTVMHDGKNYASFFWDEVECNVLLNVITEKEYAEALEREKDFEEQMIAFSKRAREYEATIDTADEVLDKDRHLLYEEWYVWDAAHDKDDEYEVFCD